MNLDWDPGHDEFRADLRAFLDDSLPERWTGIFHGGAAALEASDRITAEMADRGWLTQFWPTEWGGSGESIWRQVVFQEETWAHYEPRGGQYMGVNWIGPSIIAFGTDAQKKRFLPEIAAGRVQWAQLFSESDAGSDLAALRTRIDVHDDAFVVTGEKLWTSYADYARHGVLLARSLPGSERHNGLSVLLLDMDGPNIDVRSIETPLGEHKLNAVAFDGAVVPRDRLLGPVHDGWKVAMQALALERVGVARYARTTRLVGQLERMPEADDPALRRDLADAIAAAHVGELMSWHVVWKHAAEKLPSWEGNAARVHNVMLEQEVAAIAERMLGPAAFVDARDPAALEGGEIEEYVRLAPTGAVAAGAYDIQLGLIAQRALGLRKAW